MAFAPRMRPIPLRDVTITDAFWGERQRALAEVTIPHEWDQISVQTPRLKNFRRAAGKAEGVHEGRYFDDSDIYKWLEAAAYSQALNPRPEVEAMMTEAIGAVAAAQMPDGYLNTFFQTKHPDLRWRNLGAMHEMYCAGHLFEAAVARYEAQGKRDLLDIAIRFADHIDAVFGPAPKRRGYCGHEEIELGLFRLAEATGEARYADLARFFINERGQGDSPFAAEAKDPEAVKLAPWHASLVDGTGAYIGGEYFQDHKPVREQTEIVGHAVRGMYLFSAVAEMAKTSPDEALEQASHAVWNNLTEKRMYVTGGIGPSGHNEGFTFDYDLPNRTSYAETCAAIGLAIWGRRLTEATGDAAYADVAERAIFNGCLAGINLAGNRFFYANPHESLGNDERVPWFDCACCPPNIARLIGSITDYAMSVSDDGLWVHFPVSSRFSARLGGATVGVEIEADYPWSGTYRLAFGPETPTEFTVRIRVPEWCEDLTLEFDGASEDAEFENGYAVLRRVWTPGEILKVEMTMEPRWLRAHPKVIDAVGKAALTFGPLVYCAEGTDLGFAAPTLFVDPEEEIAPVPAPFGTGLRALRGRAYRPDDEERPLYDGYEDLALQDVEATFIPYFAWANRGKTTMAVWFPVA
ncbi:MAG: glycoside hydrolase family 127 protein [Fimbriimonadaceae bacterium]|nr:glycoside hydrolase family 127 protein [Fimbriimonadaceae bacterium]